MNRFIEQIISIPLWIFLAIPTTTQWYMTKTDWGVRRLKKASYSDIKNMMLSTNWEFDPRYPQSLFGKNSSDYFHASIFRFGDVGYLLTPYGLLMANILQRRIRKTLTGIEYIKKPYIK